MMRSEEYKGYLSRANTVESQKFLTDHNDNFTKCVETFRKILKFKNGVAKYACTRVCLYQGKIYLAAQTERKKENS
jgi:hypothetical protein